MTPAEAHVWITAYATAFQANRHSFLVFNEAVRVADAAAALLRHHAPERLDALNAALQQDKG